MLLFPLPSAQVDMLQQLQLQASALLLRLEQLRQLVTATACQSRAFCTWLLHTIQTLERSQEANAAAGEFAAAVGIGSVVSGGGTGW
jgi:hypothetical protein